MSTDSNPAELVLLHIGPSTFALPRREVRDLLEPPARSAGSAGAASGNASLRIGESDVPLLILDDTLQPSGEVPARRRICVLLENSGNRFGILCDEFEHRIDAARGRVRAHALPPAMRMPRSAVTGLLQIGGTVALLTHAKALANAFALPAEAPAEVE